MKNSIMSYNQRAILKYGLNTNEILFLRWFIDFRESGKMEKLHIPEYECYAFWCSNRKIILDLPVLFNLTLEEYEEIERNKDYKVTNAQIKRIERLLKGNLSKVVKSKIKSLGKNGTKKFLYIEPSVYAELINENLHTTNLSSGSDLHTTNMSSGSGFAHDKFVDSDKLIMNNKLISDIYISHDTREIVEKIKSLGLNLSESQEKIASKFTLEKLEVAIKLYKQYGGKSFTYLKNCYYSPVDLINKQKGSDLKFNNFTPRVYDYEDLERKLLGWDKED